MQTVTMKKPVTMRFNKELLELLDKVAACEGTMYYDRDRTWLVEQAVMEKYQPLVNKEGKTNGNGGKQKTS